MAGFRDFLRSPSGKYVGIGLVAVGILAAGYSLYANLGGSEVQNDAMNRIFINAKTGKIVHVSMKAGNEIPADCYEAELCYWTADGKQKETPTYVLLNQFQGKPEPTFCPDCGRLVKFHNPPALTNSKPPPTKDQYDARNQRR